MKKDQGKLTPREEEEVINLLPYQELPLQKLRKLSPEQLDLFFCCKQIEDNLAGQNIPAVPPQLMIRIRKALQKNKDT